MKKRNIKQLTLPPTGQLPQIPNNIENNNNNNANGFARKPDTSLELGLEFKLDIRAEDLQLLHEIGHGNGGTVSKVLHLPTQTIMAKKVIQIEAKPDVRNQILRELRIMHDCASDHIVSFYGAYEVDGGVSMCMEYMDVESLDRISKLSPIPIDILGTITLAVVNGLTYLYNEHRIIHRDVKPSNILINSSGQIKLCDFGVSGELINSIADTFVGTSTYMSPERIQGAQYTVKSDVWSLGITLIELALGRFPFSSSIHPGRPLGILDLLQQIVHEPAPQLPPEFPEELILLVNQCLNKDPAQRPNPQNLLSFAFLQDAQMQTVDMVSWARQYLIDGQSNGFKDANAAEITIQAR